MPLFTLTANYSVLFPFLALLYAVGSVSVAHYTVFSLTVYANRLLHHMQVPLLKCFPRLRRTEKPKKAGNIPSDVRRRRSHPVFLLTGEGHSTGRRPWGLSGKEPVCQCRRRGFNPYAGKIPRRRKRLLTPVFLPGKILGQRSLAGPSPWGPRGVRHDLTTKQQSAILCYRHHLDEMD